MANRRLEGVSYRPFRAQPQVAEGLLPVARDGGELEAKVAAGLARFADSMGRRADREAERAGMLAGRRAAMAGGPEAATVSGGGTATASVNGQAGHVRGARGSIRVSPREANATATAARDYLMQKHGFSAAQAAAFAGHGMQESAFNIAAVGDNGTARGIMQWRGDRLEALRRYAASAGRNVDDLETQLDFAVHELRGSEKTSGDAFFASSTVEDAVTALMGYERPVGWTADNPRAGHGYENRLSYALGFAPKGDGSYRSLPSPASVAPVSVTPVDVPVTVTPGKAGSFRPGGRDTVYGRAYDVAGTRTYLEQLELTMMKDQDAVYEAYKDDPAMLEKAYGDLLTAHRNEHVFEEIDPEYTAAFEKRAYAKVSAARDAAEQRRRAQDRVEFLGRVEDLENAKSRALAGMTVDSDTAESDIAALQGSIDQHYDSAVARGVLSPGEAEQAKRASRSDLMTAFYTKQAAGKTAAEIRTMRADMTRDYAAGKLDLDAGDWDRVNDGLMAAEKARATQDEKADADLKKRGDDLASRVARGLPVTADEIARFQLDAATAPSGKAIVASTLSRLKVGEAIRTLPIGEVEKRLPTLLGENATADDIAAARKMIASHREDLKSDPIGVAERFGILPVSPGLPLEQDADPATVSAAFSERINQAEAAAKHFGVSPRYFRPGEADQIEAAVKTDPERGVSIAAGLVDAAGDNAQSVLRELGETAPAVSGAGEIVAIGGDPKAARDLLAGSGKAPDGKAYPDMKVTKRIPAAQAIAGDALAFTPDQINRLDEQAAAIARKRLYDAGIDPKTEDAAPVYERAFQEAAGARFLGQVQFGGFAGYDRGIFWRENQVLVPPTIRADRFSDVIGALTDADVGQVKAKNGKTWTARDFQKAMPVAVNGGYVFALGDPASGSPQFIADENGKPLVLDIANMEGLKARIPEAFR